jgi:hypothetical protein
MENGVTNNTSIQSIICQPACSLGQLQTIKDVQLLTVDAQAGIVDGYGTVR